MHTQTLFIARYVALGAILCALSGCATGTGAKWYAPATWFSHKPADKVDAANTAVVTAETKAIKAAQKTAHETQVALLTVPDSRSTDVAVQSNDNTVALLDQVAGPMSAGELTKVREMIAGLISDNAEIRASAERQRAKDQEKINEISGKLTSAVSKVDYANAKLREAFDRENSLANELRVQRALFWIAGGLAILLGAAWIYVRLTIGGLPTALGRSLSQLRATSPEIAAKLTDTLDVHLSPSEQALIRLITAKNP